MLTVAILSGNQCIAARTIEHLQLLDRAHVIPVVSDRTLITLSGRLGLEYRCANESDRLQLSTALKGCDAVVYCGNEDPAALVRSACAAYAAAGDAGVRRMIYVSNLFVHELLNGRILDESAGFVLNGQSRAIRESVKAETRLQELRESSQVELTILRPGVVFGPRSVWTIGLADELLSGTAYLLDGGTGICNTTYVDNLVQAITMSLTAEATVVDRQAYIITDEAPRSWLEFYTVFALALGLGESGIASASPPSPVAAALTGSGSRKLLKSLMPTSVRRFAKLFISSAAAPISPAGQSAELSRFNRRLPPEGQLLQTRNQRALCEKAKQQLGYNSPVAFEQACRRSISWLEFAGYPIRLEGR